MPKAIAITRMERYKTEIKTQTNHQIIADEPLDKGGRDTGGTPTELLAASLASCSTITMKMYADRKGWEVEELKVTVEFEREIQDSKTTFTKHIEIKGNLDDEQRKRIYEIASKCPVHRILQGEIEVKSELV